MKKALVLLLSVIITSSAFSQDGNLKKQFYIRVGMSIPTWKYYGFDNKNEFMGEVSDNIKRSGGIFEVGSIYMLNSIKLMNGMRIGVNVDYLSLSMDRFAMDGNSSSQYFAFIGSKIGPSFSYSPVKHLVFDTYVKFNPVWVAGNLYKENSGDVEDEMYLGFMGIKYSLGVNVRYSIVMLGFEFNPGYAKLRYYDTNANKLTKEYMGNADEVGSHKTPVPCYNITLGVSF